MERHVQRALTTVGLWPPGQRLLVWLVLCAAVASLVYLLGA
jgi:hypothetical protein